MPSFPGTLAGFNCSAQSPFGGRWDIDINGEEGTVRPVA